MGQSSATFLDALVKALKDAASYNSADQDSPVAVLWPDAERQWEAMMPLLRDRLSLLTLGAYTPADRSGPAYWIRCMVERTLPDDVVPDDDVPVVYLPGVSKQDIRAVEDCPRHLQPLAELQYRGGLFTQRNGRDWTVVAFLESASGGLGIATGADQATKEAILRARHKLPPVTIERLRRAAPLQAAFFDMLLTPDVTRNLLLWLSDPAGYRKTCTEDEWNSFRGQCLSTFRLDPQEAGPAAVAEQLGLRETDAWELAWQRFVEAPDQYPGVPEKLRAARPAKDLGLFAKPESWPQDNEAAEETLRRDLLDIRNTQPSEARTRLRSLETEHGRRRTWVWARLGQAPLAMALEHLAALAKHTERALGGGTSIEIGRQYEEWAWQADNAVLLALAEVQATADMEAVSAAVTTVYRPWLDEGARAFQAAVAGPDFGAAYSVEPFEAWSDGTCLLFCDGLRLDVAHRLQDSLELQGVATTLDTRLGALPGITSSSKPAVSPVSADFTGGPALEPALPEGASVVTVEVLRRQLGLAGYQVLKGGELGDPNGRAWTESGNIDELGHTQTAKLPLLLESELQAVAHRVGALLEAGWKRVVVLTDHGWLLLPSGLPKVELPQHLTEGEKTRKGRCARLKDFAQVDLQVVPWYWDANVRISMAPGISCFESGNEYEHGGLSPQECVTPVLTAVKVAPVGVCSVTVNWRGLRCEFHVMNAPEGAAVDIRTKAGEPGSSLTTQPRSVRDDGSASIPVENDDLLGHAAFAVLLGSDGEVVAQVQTTVGGDN